MGFNASTMTENAVSCSSSGHHCWQACGGSLPSGFIFRVHVRVRYSASWEPNSGNDFRLSGSGRMQISGRVSDRTSSFSRSACATVIAESTYITSQLDGNHNFYHMVLTNLVMVDVRLFHCILGTWRTKPRWPKQCETFEL